MNESFDFERLDVLFHEALELPTDERAAFVETRCGNNPALRAELLGMLDADRVSSLLDQPLALPSTQIMEASAADEPVTEDVTAAFFDRVVAGRIRLLRSLGKGGMGQVFVGFDEKLKRQVAVKMLRRGSKTTSDEERRAHLLREARLLCQLSHPYICQVHDYFEDEERDYLVLELIEGATLRQRIAEGLTRTAALAYAEQIAQALAAAHAEGIVHCDLKPDNVMVVPKTGAWTQEQVKVLDFGVARMLGVEAKGLESERSPEEDTSFSDLSPGSPAVGTPRYMSPEQALGKQATSASDVFSFGLVLQEMLTGEPAYPRGLGMTELIMRLVQVETVPRRGLGADVEGLLARLLSTQPADRPTADEVAAQLHSIRTAPRRRLLRSLTAAVAIVLAALVIALAGLASRLEAARERAEEQARLAVARGLSTAAAFEREEHFDLALLLGLEAFRTADILETRSGLLEGVEASPRLLRFLRAEDLQQWSVAWHPNGWLLASGNHHGEIIFWDTRNGAIVDSVEAHEGRRAEIWELYWEKNGAQLVSVGQDRRVIRHRVEILTKASRNATVRLQIDRDLVIESPDEDTWEVFPTPDGAQVVTFAFNGNLHFWDAATGEAQGQVTAPVKLYSMAQSIRANRIVLGSMDGDILRWDLGEKRFLEPFKAHDHPIWSLELSPDGRLLASGAEEETVRIWDTESLRLVASTDLPEGSGVKLTWSPDSRYLAVGTQLGVIYLWPIDEPRPLKDALVGHSGWINSLAWQGDVLASASSDTTVALWDVREHVSGLPLRGHNHSVMALAVSPDEDLLASAGVDSTIRLWEVETGRSLGAVGEGDGTISKLAWSPDGTSLLASGESYEAQIWNVAERRPTIQLVGHEGPNGAVWSPDGQRVLSSSYDHTFAFWNAETGQKLESVDLGVRLHEPAWSPAGDLISIGDRDGNVHIRSAEGEPLRVLSGHRRPVLSNAWSAFGKWLATGDLDGEVRIWDARSGELKIQLPGHTGRIRDLAWSTTGRLACATEDKAVTIWDVFSVQPQARLTGRQRTVTMHWIRNGGLYIGGDDSAIRFYDLSGDPEQWRQRACQRAGRNLSRNEWRRYIGNDQPYNRTCAEFPAGK